VNAKTNAMIPDATRPACDARLRRIDNSIPPVRFVTGAPSANMRRGFDACKKIPVKSCELRLLSLSTQRSDTATWSVTYLYDGSGDPYAGLYRGSDAGSATLFATVTNDRGDVLELLDAAGSPFAAYRYDAFGAPLSSATTATALVSAALAASIAARQPLRYAGYAFDAESGLYYLSARSFDPITAQFLTRDIAKADGELSPYLYCGGNPIGAVDPSGMIMDAGDDGRITVFDQTVHNYIHSKKGSKRHSYYEARMNREYKAEKRRWAAEERRRETGRKQNAARRAAERARMLAAMRARSGVSGAAALGGVALSGGMYGAVAEPVLGQGGLARGMLDWASESLKNAGAGANVLLSGLASIAEGVSWLLTLKNGAEADQRGLDQYGHESIGARARAGSIVDQRSVMDGARRLSGDSSLSTDTVFSTSTPGQIDQYASWRSTAESDALRGAAGTARATGPGWPFPWP
jgi:RHS repeat-associated protein